MRSHFIGSTTIVNIELVAKFYATTFVLQY